MSRVDGTYLGFSNYFFRFQEAYRETLQLLIREYIIRFKSMEFSLEKEVCVVSKGRPYYIQLLRFEYDEEKGNYRITLQDDLYPLDLEELDEALKENLISLDVKEEALEKLNALLDIIKKGEFESCFGEDFKNE